MRCDEIHYTGLNDLAYLAPESGAKRILDGRNRFPEPCGHPGLQPSPKHLSGAPVKDPASMPSASPDHVAPASCPACRSSSIVTTAKSPDADSYWRCTTCGEVWNDSRRQAPRYKMPGWR